MLLYTLFISTAAHAYTILLEMIWELAAVLEIFDSFPISLTSFVIMMVDVLRSLRYLGKVVTISVMQLLLLPLVLGFNHLPCNFIEVAV